MADDLLWREERDLRPRSPEDVKDAPWAWPGEKVFRFLPVPLSHGREEQLRCRYSDDHRTPLSQREIAELTRHGFVSGALRRDFCAETVKVMRNGIEMDVCDGTCRSCRRGETIPRMMFGQRAADSWDAGLRASNAFSEIDNKTWSEWARSQMGAIDKALRVHGWCLYCVRTDEHHAWRRDSNPGHECAFSAMPVDEFNRRRAGGA